MAKGTNLASKKKDITKGSKVVHSPLKYSTDHGVERAVAAIQAVQAAEVERLLSRFRLIRSNFSKEQLSEPAIKFFKENMPNVSFTKNEKHRAIELDWKDAKCVGIDVSATMPVVDVKSNFFDIANLQIPDFVLDNPSENQLAGVRDAFRTPGESSSRLSFGMTQKTLRLPKQGELLMSVRGSPLGLYKEEYLEAIHESGDGVHEGTSY